MATEQFAGPIDYLVFAFDERADLGAGFTALLDRVEQGIIEILDIELIACDAEGAPAKRALSQLNGVTGIDFSQFDGATSNILDSEDLADIAAELQLGQVALAVVYEDRSFEVAANAWAAAGGVELFSGAIDVEVLERTLTEGNES